MGQKTDAVILARVSSKAQEDEGYSLDSQVKLLQSYSETKNLRVVKVFKIAETASKEQSRKVFHELLEYIQANSIFHLVVEKTDRLTRNMRDAVAIEITSSRLVTFSSSRERIVSSTHCIIFLEGQTSFSSIARICSSALSSRMYFLPIHASLRR